ncbi:MAG: 2-oxoacid:acceptor oxidoreductase family protein [Candidatus Magasanikbacteria bacterium]|jgi:Pyruvate/2-oxoacid:ferredoxin oxidoreductase gamma subunit
MYRILLAGDGGQGIQLIADIICHSAFHEGHEISQIPNYGLEQRGGVSLAFVQISSESIVYPKFSKPDILLIMSPQARVRAASYLGHDQTEILDIENFKDILEKNNISARSQNIFFLGMIAKKLAEKDLINLNLVKKLLTDKLSSKLGWEQNEKAWDVGVNI